MIKFIKDVIKGILFSPLNAVFILLALVHLLIGSLFKRYKNIKNDLVSFVPITIHRIKTWNRRRKKK